MSLLSLFKSSAKILTGLSAVSTLASAGGQVSGSQAEAKLEAFNARRAEEEAEILRQRTVREIDIERRRGEAVAGDIRESGQRALGEQKATFASAGVTPEGSPLLLMSDTIRESETAALRTKFGSQQEQRRITEQFEDKRRELVSEAAQAKFRAKQGKKIGFIRAGSTLLTGAEQISRSIREAKGLRQIEKQLELAQKGSGKPLIP